jgi:hypothetical protein
MPNSGTSLAITWAPADPGASAVKSKESRSAGCT